MWRRGIDRITTLGLSGLLLTIAIRSYTSPEFAMAAFSRTSMYCMYLCVANLCCCALHLFFADRAVSLFSVTRRTGTAVTASAAVITLTCIALAGLSFAVLADEAYLVSISQSMYRSGAPYVLHQAVEFNGEMTHLEEMFPARPLLFSTLIMPLHYVLGYAPHNGLILNALLFFLLLSGAGVLVLNFAGLSTAVAMQLFLAAQPLLIWCGMSGGFDLLALLMLALALTALWIDDRLMTPASARFLWATLLAFAMARYESPLIVAVLVAFFLVKQGLRPLKQPAWLLPYAVTSFCLLPLLWQLLLANQTLTRDAEGARFSFSYFQ